MKQNLWCIIVILLIATAILPQRMGDYALWQDESSELFMAKQPSLATMLRMQSYDQHPPLRYLFLYGWVRLVGENLWMWRLPSIFFSLLMITLVFRLGLDLFDWKVALFAAIFTLTSDSVYTFGTAIRHYSLYVMFSVLATLCYWRYTRHWDRRYLIAYVVSSLLMMYTLYWGIWVLLAHGIHTLIAYPRRVRNMVLPAFLIALSFLPWVYYAQRGLVRGTGTLNTTVDPKTGYNSSLPLNEAGLRRGATYLFDREGLTLTAITLAVLVGMLLVLRVRRAQTAPVLLAGLWLLVPLVLPIAITWQTGFGLLGTRLLSGTIPAVGLVLAMGCRSLPRWMVVMVVTGLLLWRAEPQRLLRDEPWWQYTAFIQENVAWHDAIAMGENNMAYSLRYHLEMAGYPTARFIPIHDTLVGVADIPGSPELWQQRMTAQAGVWLMYGTGALHGDLHKAGYVLTTPELYIPNEAGVPRFWRYALPITTPRLTSFERQINLMAVTATKQGNHLFVELNWQLTGEAVPGSAYTIRVALLDEQGQQLVAHTSPPLNGWSPTSQWQPGRAYYDVHQLAIAELPAGSYQLAIGVIVPNGDMLTISPCNAAICDFYVYRGINLP